MRFVSYAFRRLSKDHYFDRYEHPVNWWTPPPAVIAFVEWKGPEFLETPMRAIGMPWFDRVVRVDISDDSQIDTGRLNDLCMLRHLNFVAIHNSIAARSAYAELIELGAGKIEIKFDSVGSTGDTHRFWVACAHHKWRSSFAFAAKSKMLCCWFSTYFASQTAEFGEASI